MNTVCIYIYYEYALLRRSNMLLTCNSERETPVNAGRIESPEVRPVPLFLKRKISYVCRIMQMRCNNFSRHRAASLDWLCAQYLLAPFRRNFRVGRRESLRFPPTHVRRVCDAVEDASSGRRFIKMITVTETNVVVVTGAVRDNRIGLRFRPSSHWPIIDRIFSSKILKNSRPISGDESTIWVDGME